MKTLAERLKIALLESGATKTDIWRACGISSGAVTQWFDGTTKQLEGKNLIAAAKVLRVNPDWLATGKGNKATNNGLLNVLNRTNLTENSLQTITTLRRVPLISLVAAGNWSESVDNFQAGDAEQWIATTVTVKRHTYALRVEGDSMEPKFPHGAIIIVEPEDEPRNGSYVIVRQNGSDATFKQLVIDGSNTYLKPLNDRYPIMQMRDDAIICGVVKQMVMDV